MTAPRTIYAGTPIENSKMGSLAGTISFFADLRMVDKGPITQVVVSNDHVLNFGGYASSRAFSSPGPGCCGCCCPSNVVGKARWLGERGHRDFDRQNNRLLPVNNGVKDDAKYKVFLDCAMAPVEPGVIGVNYIPTLGGEDASGNPLESYLTDIAVPTADEKVVIATGAHGLIPGILREARYFSWMGVNHSSLHHGYVFIDVRQAPKNLQFSIDDGSGDSGSPVINGRNQLLGILVGRTFAFNPGLPESDDNRKESDTAPAPFILACPSVHVVELLKERAQAATIELTPRPGTRSGAGDQLYEVPPSSSPAVDAHEPFRRFEALLRTTRLGGALANAGYRHGRELNALVNQCRAVTVAWHRHHGPAWTAHLLKNLREGDHSIPREIKGVDQRALLEIMRDVLTTRGSDALKADLARFAPTLLQLAGSADANAALAQLAILDGARQGVL
jgi:hypothetical protein